MLGRSTARLVAVFLAVCGALVPGMHAQTKRRAPSADPLPRRSIDLGRELGPGQVVSARKIPGAAGFTDTLDEKDSFGTSVAALGDIDGDGIGDIAVGASRDSDGASMPYGQERGAVWVLLLNANGSVKARQKINAVFGGFEGKLDLNDGFGWSVAGLGDLDGDGVGDMAVGAYGDSGFAGAVWVLFLEPDGTVKEHRKIDAAQAGFSGPNGLFGISVAGLGDFDGDGIPDLAVGAMRDDDGGTDRGAVWLLFLDRDGTVREHRKISATAGGFTGVLDDEDFFGVSVAALGDVDGDGASDLAVGAGGDDDGGNAFGAVWVLFLQEDGGVKAHQKISATQGGFTGALNSNDSFGWSMAALGDLDGDGNGDLAVGEWGDDDGDPATGAFWVLFLEDDGTVAAHQKVSATQGFPGLLAQENQFGSGLAALGDFDGDGTRDLCAGARGDGRGAAWVLFLEPGGTVERLKKISDAPNSIASTLDDQDRFGSAVTALGDIDGDGIGDIAVGAPGDDELPVPLSSRDVGAVWVLFLREDGSVKAQQKISATRGGFTGALDPQDLFGSAVAGLGDLDGDGVGDLAVGAIGDGDGGNGFAPHVGAVWVLFLRADGTVKAHQKISATRGGFTGALHNDDYFGAALATLGDLDGDGFPELAVGAPLDDGYFEHSQGGFGEGAVWVLFLIHNGTVKAQQEINETRGGFAGVLDSHDELGSSFAPLGDLDGDGRLELAVGAAGDFDTEGYGYGRGAAWILSLEPDGTVFSQRKISEGEGALGLELHDGDDFGSSLTALGDLDGNGVNDLAIGASAFDGGGPFLDNRGGVWVLLLEPDLSVKAHRRIDVDTAGFTREKRTGKYFGSAPLSPGDLDGDGVSDIVVGACADNDQGFFQGALWLLALDGIATIGWESEDDLARSAFFNGQDVSTPEEYGRTLELASFGANLGPAIFDSTPLGPNDPGPDEDLLVGRGNILILQNSLEPAQSIPGYFDRPDDDPDGGILSFGFHGTVEPRSLDLVGIDVARNQLARVTLFDRAGRTRVYSVPAGWTGQGTPSVRTLDLTTLAPQAGFAGSATAIQTAGFEPRAVTDIEVELGSSGALDDLCWDPHPD